MGLICLKVTMQLCSDAIFGSGNSTPGGEDIALRLDSEGRPFLSGATFKGLLRESVGDCLRWTGGDPEVLNALFGRESWSGGDASPDLAGTPGDCADDQDRRLIFGDLRLAEGERDWEIPRIFTALEERVAKPGSLHTASCLRKGLKFRGELFCAQGDMELVRQGCAALKWAGLLRSRGFGRVKVTARRAEALAHRSPLLPTGLLRYRLELATAMVVPQYSRSEGGWQDLNYTDTRRALPGSAVRGLLLSTLARERPAWFEEHKAQLLGDGVRFLDALPVREEQTAIPTPMGFYEDLGELRFYSVLTRDAVTGDKRAKLGSYCTLECGGGTPRLRRCTPKTAVALRMRRGNTPEEKAVFCANAIAPGTVLEGYIQLDDPNLAPELSAAFYDWAWLGADKFAGYGLCRVAEVAPVRERYGAEFGFAPGDEIPSELYMMLLAPTSMARAGEPVGLDEEILADLLDLPPCEGGQKRLEITGCAASTVEQVGFNAAWGCATDTDVMYAPGSVFRLKCILPPEVEALRRLERTGLGMRRGEGCGQVLFLKDYPRYQKYREKGQTPAAAPGAELRRARCRWLLEHRVPGGLSSSQLGTLQALCEQAMARGGELSGLRSFFDHNIRERGVRHGTGFETFRREFDRLMQTPLANTLGCADCPDGPVERLKLICDWLDLSRKKVNR